MVLSKDTAALWVGSDHPIQDCHLTLTLPSAMKQAVAEAAESKGVSMSRWTRQALVRDLEIWHAEREEVL